MIHPELLQILVCPEDHSPLSEAAGDLIARLNAAIGRKKLINKSGQAVDYQLEGGLVRADGAVLYPIVDGIPMMLTDEGILLDQPGLSDG